ncbi:helix-turn-helix transcriptional regulator [Quadrisphaera granulorum]|uniref:helix-turn-helix transcriptional regulator n=1 Tax=Quadrisphaera granulorum TaxID=317664 RepID=UPI00147494C2|nr:AraC family transcriptional regulator [Quadrisphaera granulorum]
MAHDASRHPPHSHDEDQLYWFPDGPMTILVGARRWLVHSSAAFWFPAGVVHAVEPVGAGTTHSIYSSARLRPAGERWTRPGAIFCTPLMAELVRYTTSGSLTPSTRTACHALLSELVQHTQEERASLMVPTHPVARTLAERVLADPRDDTSLADAARGAGISERTLVRAFVTETGQGFTQWRAEARLVSSLSLLASGLPVGAVAERVGYRTTSGYIDAFRKTYGTTPAAHARASTR